MGKPLQDQLCSYQINMSHQEVERIVSELEAVYETASTSGAEWVWVEAIANLLMHDLGYEDMNEFEEALNGSFEDFLRALPSIELKQDEKNRTVFKVKPSPPAEEWQPTKLTLKITDRKQLWNVCLKSPSARIEIPELEFEFNVDGKKKVDSIYNYIASAVFNLGIHVKEVPMSEEHKDRIVDTIYALNAILDVPQPWTWVVHDPSGLSEFSDMQLVKVEPLEAAPEAAS